MTRSTVQPYSRDHLASLTEYEWRNLSLDGFFLAMAPLVTSSFSSSIKRNLFPDQYLSRDDILSELYVEGMPRLIRKHQRSTDIPPADRFGTLYGALRAVAKTVLVKKMPELTPLPSYVDIDTVSACEVSTYDPPDENIPECRAAAERDLIRMMESLRSSFTPRQYRVLYALVFDGLNLKEISQAENCLEPNAWWSIEQLRIRLYEMLPLHLQERLEFLTMMPKRLRDDRLQKAIKPIRHHFTDDEYTTLLSVLLNPGKPINTAPIPTESSMKVFLAHLRQKLCSRLPALCSNEKHFLLSIFDEHTGKLISS
jgi:hypothetical protein